MYSQYDQLQAGKTKAHKNQKETLLPEQARPKDPEKTQADNIIAFESRS